MGEYFSIFEHNSKIENTFLPLFCDLQAAEE
jgi:hypothetical protein